MRLFKTKAPIPEDTIGYDEAKRLARDGDPAVRAHLAARDDVWPEILYFLAEDDSA